MSRVDKRIENLILDGLADIEENKGDSEKAHIMADKLIETILTELAEPHLEHPDELVKTLLRIYDIDFNWWVS